MMEQYEKNNYMGMRGISKESKSAAAHQYMMLVQYFKLFKTSKEKGNRQNTKK